MRRLRIILIAHDDKKTDLVERARFNAGTLCRHDLIATAATGEVIQDNPRPHGADVAARPGRRRRPGGRADRHRRSRCSRVDVKALLRLAVLHNVPTACNRATADYLISSPLFGT
jgi:methylglyoxal synthase